MKLKSILQKAIKTCLKSSHCLAFTRKHKLELQSNFTFTQLIRDKFSVGINCQEPTTLYSIKKFLVV